MLRFRPIMMTTMAALFGAVPLAIGTGMGSELRRPLGISIIGGLIVSQVLTLYTTPVIYLFMDNLRLKLQGRNMRAHAPAKALNESVSANGVQRWLGPCAACCCSLGCAWARSIPRRPFRSAGVQGIRSRGLQPARRAPGSPRSPQDAALKGKWWEMFNEPELNALEEQLNINNQNIAQYFQNFMAARAQVSEARAATFPP
jgi:hypothetical protein